MAYSFERSIVIHATPEQVYDNLLDVASHKKWGEMTEMELLYEGPVKVGSRWRSVGVIGKDVMHDECTIIALERPHLFQFKSVTQHSSMGTAGMIFTYRLEKVPESTHVTISRGFVPDEISSKMMSGRSFCASSTRDRPFSTAPTTSPSDSTSLRRPASTIE